MALPGMFKHPTGKGTKGKGGIGQRVNPRTAKARSGKAFKLAAGAHFRPAQAQASLGRPLAGGARTVTIANVITPNTLFENRIYQLDLRLTKIVRIGRTRVQGNVDLYNLLNASPILTENTRYGAAWLTPTQIRDARLFKIGAQVSF